jgi:hypothetical protein
MIKSGSWLDIATTFGALVDAEGRMVPTHITRDGIDCHLPKPKGAWACAWSRLPMTHDTLTLDPMAVDRRDRLDAGCWHITTAHQ